jgi:hypothetical protein
MNLYIALSLFYVYLKTKIWSIVFPDSAFVRPGCLQIQYRYLGQNYIVHVPYRRSRVHSMKKTKTILVNADGTETPLLGHQPGVAYFVSPEMLGVKRAFIQHQDGRTLQFTSNELLNCDAL